MLIQKKVFEFERIFVGFRVFLYRQIVCYYKLRIVGFDLLFDLFMRFKMFGKGLGLKTCKGYLLFVVVNFL